MSDYNELIEQLKEAGGYQDDRGNRFYKLPSEAVCRKAAQAIEQLAEERDAAIADLKGFCFCCKRHIDGICPTSARTTECDKLWEWRGVIE